MKLIALDCRQVRCEISNYLDREVSPQLRRRMETHLEDCSHCHAVLEGTRNVMRLVGDERAFETPAGFGDRLFERLRKYQPHLPR